MMKTSLRVIIEGSRPYIALAWSLRDLELVADTSVFIQPIDATNLGS